MRKTIKNDQNGFTLFELIIVLILLGVMAVGLTLGLVKVVQSYMFAEETAQVSQKAQLAMARIKKELTDVTAVTYISNSRIDYTRPYSPPSCQTATGCQFRIQQVSNTIYLEGLTETFSPQILIDQVSAVDSTSGFLTFKNFSGAAWSLETNNTVNNLAQIIVSFRMIYGESDTVAFTTTINPRSGTNVNVPALN